MKLLVIEDDQSIIDAIKVALEFRWPEAEMAAALSGKKGNALVRRESPDIVILDLNLPDISGFEVLKDIRSYSQVPIIILTVRSDDADMLKGLESGADDYIVKPFNYMTLLARIKAVLRRTEALPYAGSHDSNISSRIKIDFVNQKVKVDNRLVNLTPREYRLLAVLAQNAGRMVDYQTITSEIWGKHYQGDTESIRIAVRRLREKLNDNPPAIILNQRGKGYILQN
ncbi:response regulator transcription factor [Dehalococcoides mccartyi]|jgi:two-component system KDP operon response regulator KdpE|uniref:response regulator transcription factor n=1 Tax=Dehalococcoides mccartyi TaxID=61435 RepID=UPI003399BA26